MFKITETNNSFQYEKAVQYCKKYDFINDLIFNKMQSLIRGKNKINYKYLLESKDILGETYIYFQNYSSAKTIYEKILSDIEKYKIFDEDYTTNVKKKLLEIYINLGYYDKVIELTSSNNKLKYYFIEANLYKKNYEIVEEYLFSKEPKDVILLTLTYYSLKEQYKDAEIFIKENKLNGLYQLLLAHIYILEKEYKQAKSILEAFYKLDSFKKEVPMDLKMLYKHLYAQLLEKMGDNSAEKVYKEILDLNERGYGYEASSIILCSKYRLGVLKNNIKAQEEAINLFKTIGFSGEKYSGNSIGEFCKF